MSKKNTLLQIKCWPTCRLASARLTGTKIICTRFHRHAPQLFALPCDPIRDFAEECSRPDTLIAKLRCRGSAPLELCLQPCPRPAAFVSGADALHDAFWSQTAVACRTGSAPGRIHPESGVQSRTTWCKCSKIRQSVAVRPQLRNSEVHRRNLPIFLDR